MTPDARRHRHVLAEGYVGEWNVAHLRDGVRTVTVHVHDGLVAAIVGSLVGLWC